MKKVYYLIVYLLTPIIKYFGDTYGSMVVNYDDPISYQYNLIISKNREFKQMEKKMREDYMIKSGYEKDYYFHKDGYEKIQLYFSYVVNLTDEELAEWISEVKKRDND